MDRKAPGFRGKGGVGAPPVPRAAGACTLGRGDATIRPGRPATTAPSSPRPGFPARLAVLACLLACLGVAPARAAPWADPGDPVLRHDVQVLADAGLVEGPVTTWPLSWGEISRRLVDLDAAPPPGSAAALSLRRLRERVAEEALAGRFRSEAAAGGLAAARHYLRTFTDVPREKGETRAGLDWMGRYAAFRLRVTGAVAPPDHKRVRLDGSYLSGILGNWALTVGQVERWWGPGWDGSLVLSTNARPLPSVALRRNYADAFETPWLAWIGPWTFVAVLGRFEDGRAVSHARFLGMRFACRPFRKLEIGLSRAAQWGGKGRPSDLETFGKLLIGRDNRGDDHIDVANEPGNQLAGYDLRLVSPVLDLPYALYGQFIGEDEAGMLPSRFVGLAGLEAWGALEGAGLSWRLHVEVADTTAAFYLSEPKWDYAYNHAIYRDGYRYYDRTLGHAMDNDGEMIAAELLLVERGGRSWRLRAARVRMNRNGTGLNPAAPREEGRRTAEIGGAVPIGRHRFLWGGGLRERRTTASGHTAREGFGYLAWEVTF
ncbi:capsule assembly Wzi family protein [Dissulfurirhabdus thermomarina]|uniref:Capsule assembly Wzi family protein n=1 Tax=Dissulfurirhabdus thermomarina TaxID=1765737 RepID=A0A6N9TMA4_DISTH|nr:capsule assembly Wzi family protein [Dissulfurirhabdus thermomarina]NDY42421.1 capsule assembly Wzi family protein [Dissulfurirhabdus thermomarina]NMX23547.1 capsule assembly Wzi family protein [Dissulfurirhabdus thermomarina]